MIKAKRPFWPLIAMSVWYGLLIPSAFVRVTMGINYSGSQTIDQAPSLAQLRIFGPFVVCCILAITSFAFFIRGSTIAALTVLSISILSVVLFYTVLI
ncbi:hypothetical protein [Parasphingorhabdus sp.]|uniref:hypothetical protein n=1 Tax=Parasphingorhabdus sp. TaxID=2709688 RepID=UPI0035934653